MTAYLAPYRLQEQGEAIRIRGERELNLRGLRAEACRKAQEMRGGSDGGAENLCRVLQSQGAYLSGGIFAPRFLQVR